MFMKISKKKLSDLNMISVHIKILHDHGYNFFDNPPDMWNDEQKKIYDFVTEIENELKTEMIKEIQML